MTLAETIAIDAWNEANPTACDVCGRESCEDHIPAHPEAARGLDPDALCDAPIVAAEGQRIAETGIRYTLDGIIPGYGMLGMLVAYAKTGKTTLAQALGVAIATGQGFLGRRTQRARVLDIAAEDPSEYTAYLARPYVNVPAGVMTFYRRSVILDDAGLSRIATTVREGGYGLVLISSWQAVVRGLIRDENDNAGAVAVVERVKAAARETAIPWLIDAHAGKGEDQSDDADPSRAMRGASSAAGAADYTLSLRYANGPFGTHRRLSGKGRFVSFPPIVLDHDIATGAYTVIGSTKDAAVETTWRLVTESGALTHTPQTVDVIARAAGLTSADGRVTGTGRRQVREALRNRPGVRTVTETRRGQMTTLYSQEGTE
jgi:hypothetical protein